MARVFVSGSTTGLGLLAGQQLLARGHDVIFHARNEGRALTLRGALPGAPVVIGDLSSMQEARAVAEQVNALAPLDAVIHNAGVGYGNGLQKTPDGLPDIFAVNVLAPFMLTALIERPRRLVYLSSSMHHVRANLDDVLWRQRKWNGTQAYCESKFLVTALAFAVARLRPDVFSNAVDPGWVPTRMGGRGAPDDLEEGAATQVAIATGEDGFAAMSGQYLHHLRMREPEKQTRDLRTQDRLLDLCSELSGLKLA